ncbi:MAG TPA: MBL fold metallo-hydrolase [Nitrospiraceae bacterium]|jgi:glyoxylase-like metal-dependent hydrolase (beta-lactamase superfamily II)|nr:MBL fold metallo-hydrolase [Nitrospiraceae bacterium]
MPLEDDFCDIIKKARTGQGLTVGDLARMTGLPGHDIAALERGDPPRDREEVQALAKALGLRPEPLEAIALKGWRPAPAPASITCVETIHGEISGYAVKGYVLHDSGEALLIDTGYNAGAVLDFLSRRGLRLVAICLTHGHADHAEGIDRILSTRPVPVYVGPDDVALLNWKPPSEQRSVPEDGRTIQVGCLTVRCLTTPGHTPGGICYHVEQGGQPICFVGDTLFAGSIGRANPAKLYPIHLESVRTRVLTLPHDTVLFPGHGPSTTVQEELVYNPFAGTS